jgi:cytochrome c biogenesis protein CcdA
MDTPSWIVELLESLATFLPFGYAFGAGMLATVNPCGFFMLPVYLSLYLAVGAEEAKAVSPWPRLGRALWLALVVTLGFILVFFASGLLIVAGGLALMSLAPWFALIIAVFCIACALLMLFGKNLSFSPLEKIAAKIGNPRHRTTQATQATKTTKNLFLFGLAYGLVSLACALPIFLAMLGGAIATGDAVAVARQSLAYAAGAGFILVLVTLAIAFVKERLIVGFLRKILPHSQKLTALFLLVAGIYIIFYWLKTDMLTVVA